MSGTANSSGARRFGWVLVLTAMTGVGWHGAARAAELYYTSYSGGVIVASDADGSNATALVSGLTSPTHIDLDLVNWKVYWTDNLGVRRADLDGSNVETIVSVSGYVDGLAVDPLRGKVYWCDDDVFCADLDGSNVETVVVTYGAQGIALDVDAGMMYWCDGLAGAIVKASVDGSGKQTVASTSGTLFGACLELNIGAGKVYWGEVTGDICRADMTGGNLETLVSTGDTIMAIALDLDNNYMAWTEVGANRVMISDLNGNYVYEWVPGLVGGAVFSSCAWSYADGGEFQVNTYATGSQTSPEVAMDDSGAFVVVWTSNGQDGSGSGVFGQRYGADGAPVSSEFQVNTYSFGTQFTPAVAMSSSGGFVVTWTGGNDGDSYGVFGQRFGADGNPAGSEFLVNTYTTSWQREPSVAMNASGAFVVVWMSTGQDGDSDGVFGQRFDADGNPVGSEFQVNTWTSGSQAFPAVGIDDTGAFMVVWCGWGAYGSDIYGQRYDSGGNPAGSEFKVTSGPYTKIYPSIAVKGDGSFVVAWTCAGIVGRRFGADGSALGDDFQITSSGGSSSVAICDSGAFAVAWANNGQDGDGYGVFGRRFDYGGAPLGAEFQINTYTAGAQDSPCVALSESGACVVVWDSEDQDGDSYGIFGQRYASLVPSLPMAWWSTVIGASLLGAVAYWRLSRKRRRSTGA